MATETLDLMDGIRIRECDEPLVDILKYCPRARIALDKARIKVEKTAYLRLSVAKMLAQAERHLPRGYSFIIRDAWRPSYVQSEIFFDFVRKAKKRFPDASEDKVIKEVEKYVAPWKGVNASGHMSGGAIDLRVLDAHGRRLPMRSGRLGYKENALTDQPLLPPHLRRNRAILSAALRMAGFSNYPLEFWHWSFGDYQWAKRNGRKVARYGAVSDVRNAYVQKRCPCGSGVLFKKCHGV